MVAPAFHPIARHIAGLHQQSLRLREGHRQNGEQFLAGGGAVGGGVEDQDSLAVRRPPGAGPPESFLLKRTQHIHEDRPGLLGQSLRNGDPDGAIGPLRPIATCRPGRSPGRVGR